MKDLNLSDKTTHYGMQQAKPKRHSILKWETNISVSSGKLLSKRKNNFLEFAFALSSQHPPVLASGLFPNEP